MKFHSSITFLFALSMLFNVLIHTAPVNASKKADVVYFMDNNVAENSVIAIKVADDGTLSYIASNTSTGAAGGYQVNGTGFPAGPDALASQGSLILSDYLLFALNAGSNSLSVLGINSSDPTKLELLGEPAYTGGDFPNTVAVSKDLGIICVGNTGIKSGVSCAPYNESSGMGAFDTIRPLSFGQTNPPVGPTNGIADVLFTEDESTLLVIVKGNGTLSNRGFIASFPVNKTTKQVSYKAQIVTPDGAAVMFGTTTIPDTNKLLVSDAGFGALLLDLDNLLVPIANTTIAGQKATCWAITSAATGTGFVDDVLVSHLVEIDLNNGSIVSIADPKNLGQGMIDMVAVKENIYALSPGNGTIPAAVTVFDVSGGRGTAKAVQNFVVKGAGPSIQGIAVYLSEK